MDGHSGHPDFSDAWHGAYVMVNRSSEEFEIWWSSTPILRESKRTLAEKAWRASRESVVIELPKAKNILPLEANRESAWDICKDACIDAIEEAGLKVKL